MLEIMFIAWLCKKNKQHAEDRGVPSGKYVAFTALLWFGCEILGGIIAAFAGAGAIGIYLAALVCAAGGGYLSTYLAKNA